MAASLAAIALVASCLTATPALAADAGTIANANTGTVYTDFATAVSEASSGDTLELGAGTYTLYGASSVVAKGKDLTFVGAGTGETTWVIGAETPDPSKYGTEYNGDGSLAGAGTITFKDMTLRSAAVSYLGFTHIDRTVVDGCVVNGFTYYWGYQSAEFRNTTFNAPTRADGTGEYSVCAYCSAEMTFEGCTFNGAGRAIQAYTDGSGNDIVLTVSNCAFNSTADVSQAVRIDDTNMGSHKYVIGISGCTANSARSSLTCCRLFGFSNNTGKTDVTLDGTLVWSAGKMQTHAYTDGQADGAFDLAYGEWSTDAGTGLRTRTVTKTCRYCGYAEQSTESVIDSSGPSKEQGEGETTKPQPQKQAQQQVSASKEALPKTGDAIVAPAGIALAACLLVVSSAVARRFHGRSDD